VLGWGRGWFGTGHLFSQKIAQVLVKWHQRAHSTGHPLLMFGLRNAALQTGLGRPRELLFLDLDFGLLASSSDPNFTGRHLFWLGLRVVGILHTFSTLKL
jgi:hypothetical protein